MATVNRKPLPLPDRTSSQDLLRPYYAHRNDALDNLLRSSPEIETTDSHNTKPFLRKVIGSPPPLDQQDANYKEDDQFSSPRSYRIFWYWKWEFAALLLAVGLLGAMLAILLFFNGQRVPDWGYSINLSTLLALLATILRAIIITIAGQIISQAKWAWYSGKRLRPLQHLQDFDQSSRGTLGSLFLLPKVLKGSFVTVLAAIIMVFSLAVGPFVQQAIKTKSCANPVPGINSTLPFAHFVPRQAITQAKDGDLSFFGGSQLELENAIYASLTGGINAVENQISPVCFTGNCTFPSGDPIENPTSSASSSFSTIGMCSLCVDISSSVDLVQNSTFGTETWGLPNGQNITFENTLYAYGNFASMTINSNFSWLGDHLSPALIQASRWAVANVTSLAFSSAQCGKTLTPQCPLQNYFADSGQTNMSAAPIAAACALYPCIRRTVPSITNNNLTEVLIDTTPLWPAAFDTFDTFGGTSYNNITDWQYVEEDLSELNSQDTSWNDQYHYAGVQFPCRVNGTIYTTQNASTAPNATILFLYEISSDGKFQLQNVSAPEACIYRQSETFTYTLANMFVSPSPFLQQTCSYSELQIKCGADGVGLGTGMYNLYANGNATISAIDDYFESFAQALTNRYRTTFGSPVYVADSAEIDGLLPLGEAQGIVWQDSVCTSAQWEWLLLPAVLVFLTCFLFVWTVAESWRNRHIVPVWKENVLPAILYRDNFRERNGNALGEVPRRTPEAVIGQTGKIMEIDEMEVIAKSTMVRFQRSEDRGQDIGTYGTSAEDGDSGKEARKRGWLKRRNRGKSPADSNSYLMSKI